MKKRIWPWFALGALGLLVIVRFTIIGFYNIPAGSMIPTLHVGDHLLINMLKRSPVRGEVIVFQYPKEPDKDFVKRVIAVGGDTVEIRDGVPWVNGKLVAEKPKREPTTYRDVSDSGAPSENKCSAFETQLDGAPFTIIHTMEHAQSFPSVTVPAGSYYVLGDNRDNSHDSRYWGFVPADHVRGTLLWVWYSSSR